jgi:hypothetical protein
VQLSLTTIEENLGEFYLDNKWHSCQIFHLLYDPQIIGLAMPNKWENSNEINHLANVRILDQNKKAIVFLELFFISKTDVVGDKRVMLFEVKNATLKINSFEKIYINRFYKRNLAIENYTIKEFNAVVFNKIISFFYYPKPVFLISTKARNSINSFPVDTCRKVGDYYLFGVRTSNKIMSAVEAGEIISIGLSNFKSKDLVYDLGNYGKKEKEISFDENAKHGIFIPKVVSKYQYVQLMKIYTFPSQNIYVCKVISDEIIINELPYLAHIHKFWLLSGYRTSLYHA